MHRVRAGQDHPPLRLTRLRVDLHLHSEYSPDSRTSLPDLIRRAREVGLDRIALTDHNTAEGALRLSQLEPELCIVGEEVATSEGEILAIFITASIPRGLHPEEVCDRIHAMGGLAFAAHPFDRRRAHFTSERLAQLSSRLDAIEVYNQWCRPQDNQLAEEARSSLALAATTGSDAHAPAELGHSWMELPGYGDVPAFLEGLREARHVVTKSSGRSARA